MTYLQKLKAAEKRLKAARKARPVNRDDTGRDNDWEAYKLAVALAVWDRDNPAHARNDRYFQAMLATDTLA